VRAAFDPEAFRRDGHALVERLADHLRQATGGALPVLPWRAPDESAAAWPVTWHAGGDPRGLLPLLDRVLTEAHHLHHPGYVGHQVTAPLPAAALADLVSSLLNNSMAVYEMGPVSTVMERNLASDLCGRLGFPAGATGVFTSGGSAGNLTALLAARQARAGWDAWKDGVATGAPLAFLVADQAHYSVARALQIMGLGREAAWPVPCDASFRLDPTALPAALRAARAAGRRVIGVVASAGSTATGAFDPLPAVADFCATHALWFHVDGAHGASAAFSATHRARLAGIERADSVVWDAHKLLLTPALVTAVLFRDGRRSYEAFAQEASYLFASGGAQVPWWDGAGRTLECTKLMLVLKLWTALTVYGPRFFADYVDGMFALAARFADRLAASGDFELAVQPESNIVCFRHRPRAPGATPDPATLDARQARVRRHLVEAGRFYLVQVRLPAGLFLRTTLLNPFTRDEHLDELLTAIRRVEAP
jgi:L-2,4-diaminobutyrate decarboxylase